MRENMITPVFVLLLSLSLIAISSCKEKKSARELKNIDIAGALGKGRIIPLSDIAKDIRYVALETNDTALVGNINSVFYENGLIYIVHSSTAISLFDDKGKFIRTIDRSGRGPEEYPSLQVLDMLEIDKNNGNLIVQSMDSKLNEYTKTGDFVRKIQPPDIESSPDTYNKALKIKDNQYIFTLRPGDDSTANCAVVYDSLYNILKMVPASSFKNDDFTRVNFSNSMFTFMKIETDYRVSRFEDKVRIISNYPGFILSLDKNLALDTAFTINYGPYKVTMSNKEEMFSPTAKIISWIGSLKESKDYIYLWLNLRALSHEPEEQIYNDPSGKEIRRIFGITYGLFNKNTSEVTLMNQPVKGKKGFMEDFENGPTFWPKTISSQEYLVAAYTAVEFMDFAENNNCSEKIKELAAGLNENDNPVVALVKLK